MISRIGFAPAEASLTIAQAQTHWGARHAEVTLTMPGIKRYWQNHAVLANGLPLLPWLGFDCCSEFDFDSGFDMDRTFVSDAYLDNVKPDEAYLVDKTKGGMLLAERTLLDGDIDRGEYRWLRFHRLAPLRRLPELAARLTAAPLAPHAVARELYIAVDGAAAGQRVPMYDAIEIDWFADVPAAYAAALSAQAREDRRAIAEFVRGTDHLIAHVLRVR